MSNRGKQFICWLGRYNETPLYQGDSVMYKLKKRWIKGSIHCIGPTGKYVFRHRKREFCVCLVSDLRAI